MERMHESGACKIWTVIKGGAEVSRYLNIAEKNGALNINVDMDNKCVANVKFCIDPEGNVKAVLHRLEPGVNSVFEAEPLVFKLWGPKDQDACFNGIEEEK